MYCMRACLKYRNSGTLIKLALTRTSKWWWWCYHSNVLTNVLIGKCIKLLQVTTSSNLVTQQSLYLFPRSLRKMFTIILIEHGTQHRERERESLKGNTHSSYSTLVGLLKCLLNWLSHKWRLSFLSLVSHSNPLDPLYVKLFKNDQQLSHQNSSLRCFMFTVN